MLPEIIRYQIPTEKRAGFEQAYAEAGAILRGSPHCLGYELLQAEKDPANYVLIIRWDSAAGHLEGFRRSAEFRAFVALVGPYLPHMPEMEHYQITPVTWQRDAAEGRS